jgi:nucleoside-diphosphate-sugar epimerase
MNLSAARAGIVRLRNRHARRTILFLDDLWSLVRRLLEGDVAPGVCNVGSWSGSMGQLAQEIAAVWGAEVVDEGDSPTYSFELDTARMRHLCGAAVRAPDLAAQCRSFVAACEGAGHPGVRRRTQVPQPG